jgi:hypothetical protein
VHCSKDNFAGLLKKLDETGRLALFRQGETREKFASGAFSVTSVIKDLRYDRFIVDSRPRNELEQSSARWVRSLAAGDLLCHLVLGEGEKILASTNDARDFYNLFEVSRNRSARNAFALHLAPEECRRYGLTCWDEKFADCEYVVPALSTLAMGDAQAVELAQTAHLGLALQKGILSPERMVALRLPLPRARVGGIVIDDFVSLARVPRSLVSAGPTPSEGALLADKMQDAYREVGLIPREDKAQRDFTKCSFWGIDLDGGRGLVRGSLKRAVPLAYLVSQVIEIDFVTVGLLEMIAGGFIALFVRRRMMCLLDEVFRAMRGRSQDNILQLGPELRAELLTLVGLVPAAVTDIRAEFCSRAYTVDASDWGEAVRRAPLDPSLAAEVARHSLKKGTWTRLLAPGAARLRAHGDLDVLDELPNPHETYRTRLLWMELFETLTYRTAWKRESRAKRHINIGELRAFLKAERLSRQTGKASRVLIGGDSQVALGAVLKGRSASSSRNKELQASLGAGGLYSYCLYVPTKVNPADAPTRGLEVPRPVRPSPSWWASALEGRFEFDELDEWLQEHDCDPYSLSGLSDPDELLKPGAEEVRGMVRKTRSKANRDRRRGRCLPSVAVPRHARRGRGRRLGEDGLPRRGGR